MQQQTDNKSHGHPVHNHVPITELAAIIQSSEDAIIGKTLDGTVFSWNKSAEEMYGYTAEEMIGESIGRLAPKDAHDEIPEILERISKGQRVKHFETIRIRKDGSPINVSLSVSPIINSKGKTIGAAAIARDISDRKNLEDIQIKLVTALESANKELEAFSYSVSHDLRAPLRAIDGFSQTLKEDYGKNLGEAGKDIINTIRKSTRQMTGLIEDLLTLSHLGHQDINAVDTHMTALAKEIFEILKRSNPKRSIKFTCDILPISHADPILMRQVWMNLLSNALKFTKKKKNATITVGSKTEGDTITYHVKDNGAGFDMKYKDKLFGVFQRLHSTEEFEGTGIGLSLVKRIIERHGGTVSAKGAVGEGATFSFTLPKRRVHTHKK